MRIVSVFELIGLLLQIYRWIGLIDMVEIGRKTDGMIGNFSVDNGGKTVMNMHGGTNQSVNTNRMIACAMCVTFILLFVGASITSAATITGTVGDGAGYTDVQAVWL